MNNKAKRQQIEFPPLLNLSKDRPHVDSSFRNVEKNNSPFLNSMLQPFYKKETNTKSVYDRDGNEYHLSNSSLYKNGELLTSIADRKFKKEEITAEFANIDSFDASGNNKAYITKSGDCYWNDTLLSSSEGVVVESRVRIIDGEAIYVVYYDISNIEYVRIVYRKSDGSVVRNNFNSVWYYYEVHVNTGFFSTATRPNVDPCIHIGKNNGNLFVSLTAYTGEVTGATGSSSSLTTQTQAIFQTFYVGNSIVRITRSVNNTTTSTSEQITQSWIGLVTKSQSTKTNTRTVVTNDYRNYYVYNATATSVSTLTKVDDIPSGYNFTQRKMTQKLDNTDYDVLQFGETTISFTISLRNVGDNATYSLNTYMRLTQPNRDYQSGAWQMPKGQTGTEIVVSSDDGYSDGFYYFTARSVSTATSTGGGTLNSANLSFTYKYYQGQSIPTFEFWTAVAVTRYSLDIGQKSFSIPVSRIGEQYETTWTVNGTTTTSNTGRATIILDDGLFYSLTSLQMPLSFNTNSSAWSGSMTNVQQDLAVSFTSSSIDINNALLYTTPRKWITIGNSNALRGFAYNVDQNFFATTVKICSYGSAQPTADQETGSSRFVEAFYSNAIDEVRYCPGTTRKSNYNNYSLAAYGNEGIIGKGIGASEDLLTFVSAGFRVRIPNSNFNILYNVYTSGFSFVQGLSYSSTENYMGTLLTPWQSIDEHSYVVANGDTLWYRNKDDRWYKISIENEAELSTILEDRIVVINTTSYTNAYDSEKGEFFHYASDYNGRVLHGRSSWASFAGTLSTSASQYSQYSYIRYTADAINPLYETMPRDVFTSIILPIVPRYRCYSGEEKSYKSYSSESYQGIDVFYSDFTTTTCKYRSTIKGYSVYVKHGLQGLNYPGSTSTSPNLTPNIFTKYINGAGNNDIALEDYDAYTMTYYDNQPYLLYSSSTQVSNLYNDKNSFFVLQGQFYGIIGDKLYSLVYSAGAISGMDAIIDLGDLQFIGNNPMIAFFYDPATRVIRSFTGDANLETLYSATKIKEYKDSWYDETTQSIFAATDAGLLVFGPRNTFMLEEYKNVSLVQFSNDGVTHITNNGKVDNLVYYETEGYEPIPIDFETSFYGLGSTESTSIDRWNITLYDLGGNHPSSYITVGVRSLTDITVKSEEKTFKITPDMYDKWSNSVFISYNPKLIKGQGIRLYIKTPLTIQSITSHIMDNNTGTTTQRSV